MTNTLTGALVGGSMSSELIPISIADLYVTQKKNWINFHQKQITDAMSGMNTEGFRKSRKSLLDGEYQSADGGIGEIKQTPEGQFEYTADLSICYFNKLEEEIIDQDTNVNSTNIENKKDTKIDNKSISNTDKLQKLAEKVKEKLKEKEKEKEKEKKTDKSRRKLGSAEGARNPIISNFRNSVEFPFKTDNFGNKDTQNKHEMSFLNMNNGVSTSQHVHETLSKESDEKVILLIVRLFFVLSFSSIIFTSES